MKFSQLHELYGQSGDIILSASFDYSSSAQFSASFETIDPNYGFTGSNLIPLVSFSLEDSASFAEFYLANTGLNAVSNEERLVLSASYGGISTATQSLTPYLNQGNTNAQSLLGDSNTVVSGLHKIPQQNVVPTGSYRNNDYHDDPTNPIGLLYYGRNYVNAG